MLLIVAVIILILIAIFTVRSYVRVYLLNLQLCAEFDIVLFFLIKIKRFVVINFIDSGVEIFILDKKIIRKKRRHNISLFKLIKIVSGRGKLVFGVNSADTTAILYGYTQILTAVIGAIYPNICIIAEPVFNDSIISFDFDCIIRPHFENIIRIIKTRNKE